MNKHGWGLRVELAFLLLFLVCLIIASVGLSQFGLLTQEQEYSSPSESYYVLENEISTAAKKYYKKQYPNGHDNTVLISVQALKTYGYLDQTKDRFGNNCTGYSQVLSTGTVTSYIKCKYYTTTGYDERNDI